MSSLERALHSARERTLRRAGSRRPDPDPSPTAQPVPAGPEPMPWHAHGAPVLLAVYSLPGVIANLQHWIVGIAFSLATLVAAYAGLLRLTAAGDSSQIERSKEVFKSALFGYALALLAPVLLQILKGIVGG